MPFQDSSGEQLEVTQQTVNQLTAETDDLLNDFSDNIDSLVASQNTQISELLSQKQNQNLENRPTAVFEVSKGVDTSTLIIFGFLLMILLKRSK